MEEGKEEIQPIVSVLPESLSGTEQKNKKAFKVFGYILGVVSLISLGAFGFWFYQQKTTPASTPPVVSAPTPTSVLDETANWKTATVENVSFKYPSNWSSPEIIQIPFGSALDIKSSDNLYRLSFLTGLNRGYSLEDLEKFINDLVSSGAEKILVDNNLASVGTVEHQDAKTVTAYILAPTKDQHYALALTSEVTKKEIRILLDQILSTFKFLD